MREASRGIAALVIAVLLSGELVAGATNYTVVNLGTFQPNDINDLGQIVGKSGDSTALWLPSSAYGLPAGVNIIGTSVRSGKAINNLGQVTGGWFDFSPHKEGVAVWLPMPAYNLPAGWNFVFDNVGGGLGINNSGQITGSLYRTYNGGDGQGFIWSPSAVNGSPSGLNQLLPTYGVGSVAGGAGINDNGEAVGTDANPANNQSVPWLYLPQSGYGLSAGMHFLPKPGGQNAVRAAAINSKGVIAGSAGLSSSYLDQSLPFFWSPDDGFVPHQIGNPTQSVYTCLAYDVNDSGLIVGTWNERLPSGEYNSYAFLYDTNTSILTDLNTVIDPASGWHLNIATRINNAGQIIGSGTFNGSSNYFELVVPEPALLWASAAVFTLRSKRERLLSHGGMSV